MYKNFFDVFPSNQDPGAAPVYSTVYTVYLSVVTCAPPKFLYVADPVTQILVLITVKQTGNNPCFFICVHEYVLVQIM